MDKSGQLTFDDIPAEVLLNPSVELPDEDRLEGYCKELYHLFIGRRNLMAMFTKAAPVSTADLMEKGKAQYNARLMELRMALIPMGWCIDRIKGEGGTHYYDLVPLEKSSYYKKRKDKMSR